MNDLSPSIIEYLGKLGDGILVLVGLIYEGAYYESTFYYDSENIVLTIPEELEEIIGDITEYPNYKEILASIIKKIVPYDEMFDRLDPLDLRRWTEGEIVDGKEGEIIN
ncbi:hypothetical protein EBU94_07235 [bacterium]|nr:hypothetical protein [bacterium]